PFTVSHAMERNKYLYSISRAAVIVDSDIKGGTWSGAIENHKHKWVPAAVRMGRQARQGNQELVSLGLRPLEEERFFENVALLSLLTQENSEETAPSEGETKAPLPLFERPTPLYEAEAHASFPQASTSEDTRLRTEDRLGPVDSGNSTAGRAEYF